MLISYSKMKNSSGGSFNKLKPGLYSSEIVEVKTPEGYCDGEAFELIYRLTDDKTGTIYDKTEVFFNDTENPRTAALLDGFTQNGVQIAETDDFVGIKEQVTLQYAINKGRRFLNIVERTFVGKN